MLFKQENTVPVFTLSTIEEVRRFERLLDTYCEREVKYALTHIPLVKAFEYCLSVDNGSHLFASILDIHINAAILWCDSCKLGSTWNKTIKSREVSEGEGLTDEEMILRFDVQKYASSFVLRCRALWDKLMGLYVLMFAAEKYESFVSARSRKKAFKKITGNITFIPNEFVDSLLGALSKFDDAFRTAEAHGTGTIRKWSFNLDAVNSNPNLQIIEYWNLINAVLHTTAGIFDPSLRSGDL